jgi:hypothetical protein|tara:strand:+ start:771 stop:1082 length:312 start_codon:yes stop_codon:yes gene_type:complete
MQTKDIPMAFVEAFEAHENESTITEALEADGCVCVHGLRTEVRRVLNKICEQLNDQFDEDEIKYRSCDYNHADTEVGYAYNGDDFDLSTAEQAAIKAYDRSAA